MTTRSSARFVDYGEVKQGHLDGASTHACRGESARSTNYAPSWRGWAAAMFAAAATIVSPAVHAQFQVEMSVVRTTQHPTGIAVFCGRRQDRHLSGMFL